MSGSAYEPELPGRRPFAQPAQPAAAAAVAPRPPLEAPSRGLSGAFQENRTLIIVFALIIVTLIVVIAWLAMRSPSPGAADSLKRQPPPLQQAHPGAQAPLQQTHPGAPSPLQPAHPGAPAGGTREPLAPAPAPPHPVASRNNEAPPSAPQSRPSAYQEFVRTVDDEELARYANLDGKRALPRREDPPTPEDPAPQSAEPAAVEDSPPASPRADSTRSSRAFDLLPSE